MPKSQIMTMKKFIKQRNKVYWTTKQGDEIDIDDMSIDHLRNTLKMIVKHKEINQIMSDSWNICDATLQDTF